MSIDDALAKVTSVPANTILMPGQVGTLAVDAWGDAVVFELREGEFQLVDARGVAKIGKQKIGTGCRLLKVDKCIRQR